jgi:hypothetical protein
MNGSVAAERYVVDDETQLFMAKFPRSEVQALLDPGQAELTVTGSLIDGSVFVGTDTIRVVGK